MKQMATRAHLAMILFALVMSGSFSIGRLALPYIDPLPLTALRFVMASAVLAIFLVVTRSGVNKSSVSKAPIPKPTAPWRYAITGALTATYFCTMFIALTMTTPVATSAVFTLMPIMSAIAGYFLLSQSVSVRVSVSLLIAGLGSIWVIFQGSVSAILAFEIGNGELIYLFGCACYAIYAPLLRRFHRGEALPLQTFYNVTATAIWIVIVSAPGLLALDWASTPVIVWWVMAYLAIFSTCLAFFLLQFASLHLPASKVTAYGYLVPAIVIIYEGLLGNGWTSLSVALGAGITTLALVVLYFAPEKQLAK